MVSNLKISKHSFKHNLQNDCHGYIVQSCYWNQEQMYVIHVQYCSMFDTMGHWEHWEDGLEFQMGLNFTKS